ncbi:gamma-glutamyltranspeptidase / glutathione hydrolase [Roseateles sp. YR242]|uniref:gamma-glutamyltransferase family protein n=1 Tax=Roseateles sp. YR242 TaxID=1855305 RepID=UPI0008C1B015|nr:gamma-glutamyltransferase family protein [Roseateles sp. YR242]SEL21281.1 gamma-glutamyltranspeptidase / glutathione hydrolase [Roseateles sp. YR242]
MAEQVQRRVSAQLGPIALMRRRAAGRAAGSATRHMGWALAVWVAARVAVSVAVSVAASVAASLAGPAWAQAVPPPPEAASGWTAKPGWTFQRQAVAAANPAAAQAGLEMLRQGGSAVDAAVAAQMVLGLVEPQSSGIGGGAFLMLWDGDHVVALDGRETAPAAADETLFLNAEGQALPFQDAVQSGLSVGVPGTLRLLELAHRRYGRLPWARLFEPAIRLAADGFVVGPRLSHLAAADPALRQQPRINAYLMDPHGRPWPAGHRLRNPAYAAVLRRIAKEGADAFYRGAIARDIVAQVRGHASRPGRLQLTDLAAYRVQERAPLCQDWRAWRLCGFPPPGSGAIAIDQILGVLDRLPAPTEPVLTNGLPGAEFLHRYAEASRLAFADRAAYVADPDFVKPPAGDWRSLLAPAYLRQRAALVGERSMGEASAGRPEAVPQAYAPQPDQPEHGTSHLAIVDAQGMALSMTTTIEAQFGSRLMSDGGTGLRGGFFLNNELTDFSLQPRDEAGQPMANRVEPGKRPRSAMSPTLVFRRPEQEGEAPRFVMTVGSPGGAAIIHFVAKALIGSLDWGLDPQEALNLPNFGSFNGPTVLEAGRFPSTTVEGLVQRGHRIMSTELTSGAQAVMRLGDGRLRGAADPRREGEVRGD